MDDNILDDTRAFSPLNMIRNEKNYYKKIFSEGNTTSGFKYYYQRDIESDSSFTQAYYIIPEENSDYSFEISSDINNGFSYRLTKYEVKRDGTKKLAELQTNLKSTSLHQGFSLKKDRKYELLIEIFPNTINVQTFSMMIQQDNWVYMPEGGLVTGKHTEDLYLCDEALKVLADRDGTSMFKEIEWEDNKKKSDFAGNLTENILDTIYNDKTHYSLKLIDSDNVFFELMGEASTGSTYGGFITAPFAEISALGTFFTIVGAVTTVVVNYPTNSSEFRAEMKNCFIDLSNRNDKSIVVKHEIHFGERVLVDPWIYKYVNKYNENGEKLNIYAYSK